MKAKWKKGIWLVFALGWWGALYPDLSLMEDTYHIIYEASADGTAILKEDPKGSELYYRILSAEPGQVKIKSKLLQEIADYFGKGKEN